MPYVIGLDSKAEYVVIMRVSPYIHIYVLVTFGPTFRLITGF
jgi:hypothetical protein